MIIQTKKKNGKVILIGNGGSSAIASHISVDLNKAVGIKSMNFNEYDLITCLSNDFGYENWMAEGIKHYADKNDVVVLTSVSGTSPNVVNAAKTAKDTVRTATSSLMYV